MIKSAFYYYFMQWELIQILEKKIKIRLAIRNENDYEQIGIVYLEDSQRFVLSLSTYQGNK